MRSGRAVARRTRGKRFQHVCCGFRELCVPVFVMTAWLAASSVLAQTRAAPRRAAPAAPPKTIVPDMNCPAPLGTGVRTKLFFCEILAGRDPAGGMLIAIPPHKGPATLTFDLHNLHLYSEELVKAKRAYSRYTATIGVLTMDNTLISRAVVQNEFRDAGDLIDRITGGAGPGGVKAVAPTGTESIVVTIPEGEDRVSLLGEKVAVETRENSATYSQPGRPIAVVSNVQLEYRPAPPPKTPPAKTPPRKRGR
jgi:hypothetical protein